MKLGICIYLFVLNLTSFAWSIMGEGLVLSLTKHDFCLKFIDPPDYLSVSGRWTL